MLFQQRSDVAVNGRDADSGDQFLGVYQGLFGGERTTGVREGSANSILLLGLSCPNNQNSSVDVVLYSVPLLILHWASLGLIRLCG